MSLISLDPCNENYADELDPVETFEEYADFERVAVTPSQIASLSLPTRPPKPRDRAKGFVHCVEVDAIPAKTLRAIAARCIEQRVDRDQLEVLRVVEKEERDILGRLDVQNLAN